QRKRAAPRTAADAERSNADAGAVAEVAAIAGNRRGRGCHPSLRHWPARPRLPRSQRADRTKKFCNAWWRHRSPWKVLPRAVVPAATATAAAVVATTAVATATAAMTAAVVAEDPETVAAAAELAASRAAYHRW
ncbi:unnamed protein product, partial [Phaeothamnion confervicola]